MPLIASTNCMNGENLGVTSVHTVRARESHKPTTNTPEHWAELRSVSQNTRKKFRSLPSHRRRDGKSQITPRELSQLRASNGQLLWLGMQCLPQLLAPLSLLMGQTPQATVDTICEVNKLARKATVWAKMPLKIHVHHSLVVVTHTDAGWTTRPDGTLQGRHRKRRVAARQRIKNVSDILALESSETCGKIVICSRNSSSSRRR